MSFNIAIDGPAGAGKSTIAKLAAKELSFIYVDTGAMYRTIALGLLRAGTDIEDEAALKRQLSDIEVTISYENGAQQVFLNGENVTGLIRTEQVSDMTSRSSAGAREADGAAANACKKRGCPHGRARHRDDDFAGCPTENFPDGQCEDPCRAPL